MIEIDIANIDSVIKAKQELVIQYVIFTAFIIFAFIYDRANLSPL